MKDEKRVVSMVAWKAVEWVIWMVDCWAGLTEFLLVTHLAVQMVTMRAVRMVLTWVETMVA